MNGMFLGLHKNLTQDSRKQVRWENMDDGLNGPLGKMRDYLLTAQRHHANNELDSALNQLRKFVEQLVLHLAKEHDWDLQAGNEIHMAFSKTKKLFMNEHRRMLGIYLDFLKELGNFGSHHQDKDKRLATPEDVEYCVYIANRIFEDYFFTNETSVNLPEIKDVVACPYCEQPVGKPCIKGNGKPVAANCEHIDQKKDYEKVISTRLTK